MNCISCNMFIAEIQHSYNISDIGVELTVVLEEQLNTEVDQGFLCNNCLDIAISHLSQRPDIPRTSRFVWCLDPIIGCHTHSLPEGLEREYITRRTLPRQIQTQSKVCYVCWLAVCRKVQGTSLGILGSGNHNELVENRPSTSNETENCIWV